MAFVHLDPGQGEPLMRALRLCLAALVALVAVGALTLSRHDAAPVAAASEDLVTTTAPVPTTTTTVPSTTTTTVDLVALGAFFNAITTTTTAPPPPPTTRVTVPPTRVSPPTTRVPPTTAAAEPAYSGGGLPPFLVCVRQRESKGIYSINTGNGYYGAFQFSLSTWNNTANHAGRSDLVGVLPSNASPADQDAMAIHLLNWYGRSPWAGPGC